MNTTHVLGPNIVIYRYSIKKMLTKRDFVDVYMSKEESIQINAFDPLIIIDPETLDCYYFNVSNQKIIRIGMSKSRSKIIAHFDKEILDEEVFQRIIKLSKELVASGKRVDKAIYKVIKKISTAREQIPG